MKNLLSLPIEQFAVLLYCITSEKIVVACLKSKFILSEKSLEFRNDILSRDVTTVCLSHQQQLYAFPKCICMEIDTWLNVFKEVLSDISVPLNTDLFRERILIVSLIVTSTTDIARVYSSALGFFSFIKFLKPHSPLVPRASDIVSFKRRYGQYLPWIFLWFGILLQMPSARIDTWLKNCTHSN